MKQLTAAFFLFCMLHAKAQDYSNYQQQTARIQAMAASHPGMVQVGSLAKTTGSKDIWMITLGAGDTRSKPAIAVVGGVEGNHLLGTELAIGFAETLLRGAGTDSIKNLLAKTTFYIFPNMSPDAMEQYFGKLKYERLGNAASTDDDRDGKQDEDGYEDLDGNGKITQIRIQSPLGNYKTHPDDPRVLIRADNDKGEKGNYLVYTEGIDNDKDGKWNEDGGGGVWFNRNFTYKPVPFSVGAGEFAASEKETRALADTLYQLFNVYAVVSFSSNNNLSAPVPYNAALAGQSIVAGYLEPDAKVNALVSDLYNKMLNMKDAPRANPAGGDLLSWAYYHYGRYSFSTPGWFVPKAKPDTAKKEKPLSVDDPVANYLRWAKQQNITGTFTEWKAVSHPDFAGQQVEAGGIDPFVLINPPFKMVGDIVSRHTAFIMKMAEWQPEIDIVNLRVEKVAAGVSRITVNILNKGAFASYTKLGERSYWVKRIGVKVTTAAGQTFISGKRTQLLNSLEGFRSEELSWLVKGPGKISIEAGSPTTGTKKIDLNL